MKKWLRRIGIFVSVVVFVVLGAVGAAWAVSVYKQSKTYEVAFANVDIPSEPDLIEGERLFVARGCASPDCHDADAGGHVMMEDGPFGTIAAANLTVATRDFGGQDWDRAVRHGLREDGTALLFMPSHDFVQMSDRELGLIAGYVRTLPAVERELPQNEVGMLARVLDLAGVFPLFPAADIDHASVADADPEPGRTVEYGQYLAALCSGCHGHGYSGGPIPGAPPEFGTPPNLTPHETGLAGWTEDQLRAVLRSGEKPDGSQIDPQQMPWPTMGRMTDDEIGALFMFLQSLPPTEEGNR